MKILKYVFVLSLLFNTLFSFQIKLDQVSSFGGFLKEIIHKQNNIFISTSNGLKIFDSSDKTDIKLISKIDNLGACGGMDIKDNYLFLASINRGLIIIDISDLKNPKIVSTLYFLDENAQDREKTEINGVKINGNFAYMAIGKKGLAIINVSDLKNPKIDKILDLGNYVKSLDVDEDNIYVLTAVSLKILNKNSFETLSVLEFNGYGNDIKVKEGYAYVATTEGLNIIDVSNVKTPSLRSSLDTQGYCLRVEVFNDYAYIANGIDIKIVKVSNKEDPVLINSFGKSGVMCHDVESDGDYLYVLNNDKPCVLDISDKNDIKPLSSFDMVSLAKKILIDRDIAYIVNDYQGIQIANIKDLKNIKLLSVSDLGGVVNDAVLKGNKLFVALNNGIRVLDVFNIRSPQIISSFNLEGVSKSITLKDDYLFVADYDGGLKVMDISNPYEIKLISTYDTKESANYVKVYENYLLVAEDNALLEVFDIKDPENLKFVSSLYLDSGFGYSIDIEKDIAFVADGDRGVCAVDLRNIESLNLKSCIETFNAKDIKVKDGVAFVADDKEGIAVIDVRDPKNMAFLDRVYLENRTLGVTLKDNVLFSANYSDGIKVYRVLTPPKDVNGLKKTDVKSHSLILRWEIPKDGGFIDKIKIFRDGEFIGSLDGNFTSFSDLNLKSDTLYRYEIKTSNALGDSKGVSIEVKTLKTAPLPVSSLRIKELRGNRVVLEWKDDSDNEDGFEIFRNGKKIAFLPADSTTFEDRNVTVKTDYRYGVRSVNEAGVSNEVFIDVKTPNDIPIPPTSLEGIVINEHSVKLVWEDNSDNEESFEIFRNGSLIAEVERNVTSYIDSGLEPGVLYEYGVRAKNFAGVSAADEIKIEIKRLIPLPPTNFTASALSENSIILRWRDNSDNEEGFEIYRDGALIQRANSGESSFIDENLKPDTLYRYSIRAYNQKGFSAKVSAKAATFKIDKNPPFKPEGFKAKALSSKIVKLLWKNRDDGEVRGYNLYRDSKLLSSFSKDTYFYFDTDLIPDREYVYEIRAFNSKGESEGDIVRVKTAKFPTQKPKAPLFLKAAAVGDRMIELRWRDNSDNEEGFEIYRDGELIHTAYPDENLFLDKNLLPASSYTYEIRAVNDLGYLETLRVEAKTLSREDMIIPPTDLYATLKSGKYVVLEWKDNSDNEDGFAVFRNGEPLFVTGANETEFVDYGIDVNESEVYIYEVRAFNSKGYSIGDSVKVFLDSIKELSVDSFKASKEGMLTLKLSWMAKDTQGFVFKIFRDGELLYEAKDGEEEYIDDTLTPDTEHTYTLAVFRGEERVKSLNIKATLSLTRVQKFIYNLYESVLERRADEGGLSYWSGELENKRRSALSVAKEFIKSKEFESKNVDSESYVKILYKTFFDREPEESGLEYWVNLIDKEKYPKDMVFYKFAFSKEFENICKNYGIENYTLKEKREVFVERFYQMVLGRSADRESLEFWRDKLSNKEISAKEMAKSFFFSDEFKRRNISTIDFVKIVYRTLLDREPDKAGLDYWSGMLEKSLSREKFLDMFLNSEEFSALSKEGFVNSI